MDQSGIYNNWLALDVPYHGLNIFNIWQMPRMPSEYRQFLGEVGRNQIRTWQVASVKYLTAPADVLKQFEKSEDLADLFEPVMYYRFVISDAGVAVLPLQKPETDRDQVLLKFNDYVPRFALYYDWEAIPLEHQCRRIADPSFDVLGRVVLEPSAVNNAGAGTYDSFAEVAAQTTRKSATVHTRSDRAGVLMFTQRYQPEFWSVTVDGAPAKLLRCNFICMGVFVPPGEHEVVFRVK
jgi:hypothetical protein